MKVCSKCKQEKELDDFPKRKKSKDGYNNNCKKCEYELSKKSYYKLSKKRNQYLIERRRKLAQERNELIKKLNLSCKECDENHPATLDFHHINSDEKYKTVSDLKWSGCSNETFLKEIEKCDVLCANCHRKLHWEEKLTGDERPRPWQT
jgi:hypothetical protein